MKEFSDCNNCAFCIPKEFEQTEKKEFHICKKYNKRLYHLGEHPKITPYSQCTTTIAEGSL